MSNILANIFSAGDALRRSVADAVTSPMLHAAKVVGYGLDRSRKVEEDLLTSATRSVLVSDIERQAAKNRVTDVFAEQLGGAGIIVPVGALPGMTRSLVADISQQLSQNPAAAYINHGVHRQPLTGSAVKNISDKGQRIPNQHLATTGDGLMRLKTAKEGGKDSYPLHELVDLERYPPDLRDYLRNLTVSPQGKRGAAYYRDRDKITLGPEQGAQKLVSNLLHEMQHGSQYLYDMPRGGSPVSFFSDYGRFSTAEMRGKMLLNDMASKGVKPQGNVAAFSQAKSDQDILSNPDAINSVLGMLRKVENRAQEQYELIGGEVEARLVQNLFERGPNEIGGIPVQVMRNQMMVNPDNLIHPNNVSKMPKVDADPVTQSLIRMLIGEKQ